MSIEDVTYYWVTCDVCGYSTRFLGAGNMRSVGSAIEVAQAWGWHLEGGNHVCPGCTPDPPEEER